MHRRIDFASREVIRYAPAERLRAGERVLDRARQPGADIERLKSEIFTEYLRIERPTVSSADALTAELSSFAECVTGHRTPVVDGRAGLAAMRAAEQVLQSIVTHRWNGTGSAPTGPFVIPFLSNPLGPAALRSAA
jgi:predicted dehydrogenase